MAAAEGAARMPLNLGAKGLSEVLSRVLRFLLAILAARWLGAADYGFYAFAFTLVFVLAQLSDFGLPTFACREIARDAAGAAAVVGQVLRRKLELTAIAVAGAVLASLVFANAASERLVFWLLTLSIVLTSISDTINWIFRGFHLQVLEAAVVGTNAVAGVGLGALGLALGWGGAGLAAGVAAGSALAFTLALRCLARIVSPRRGLSHFALSAAPIPWRSLIELAVITQLGFVPYALDLILLQRFHSRSMIGYFSVASRIQWGAMVVPLVVMSVVFPAFAAAARQSRLAGRQLSGRTLLFLLAAGIFVAGVLLAGATPILRLVFGEEFVAAAPCLRILGATLILLFPGLALRDLLVASGRQEAVARVVAAGAVVHIAASLLLVATYGQIGVAWAAMLEAVGMTACLTWLLLPGMLAGAPLGGEDEMPGSNR